MNLLEMNKESIFKEALFIRLFETKLLELFSKGLLNGTVHTCVGQEIIPVIISKFLNKKDAIFSNHRGHGHYIASGGDVKMLLAEMLGKKTGISGGIGGSQHLSFDNFYSNGIQGGMTSIASGFAYSKKNKTNSSLSVCYIGDGTLGEGHLYESFGLSSYFKSPVIYVLENNKYAQSTPFDQVFRGDIKQRAEGFGLNYFKVDIWNIENFIKITHEAINLARKNNPVLLEVECYRLNSHSKGDDNRPESEIKKYFKKDPINLYINSDKTLVDEYILKINKNLDDLVQSIKDDPNLEILKSHTYLFNKEVDINANSLINSKSRINNLIYNSLNTFLESNKNSIFIGEDIQNLTKQTEREYGGAFKVSSNLSDIHPEKVFNTSISEAGIIGFGIGFSLAGNKSVVEIMFGDFLTLGFDTILQQASKIPEMYGNKVDLQVVIRTPMGGRRGYGPTHSQNIERFFSFIPNVNLYALNSFLDIKEFYKNIFQNDSLSIVIEDKILYTKTQIKNLKYGYNVLKTDEKFPTIILETQMPSNCIILCYGAMIDEVFDSIDYLIEEEIFPLVICPSSISNLNLNPIIKYLKKIKRIITINEGSKYGSITTEVISYLKEKNYDFDLFLTISNESIIPCSKSAELNLIPNSKLISKTIINKWT